MEIRTSVRNLVEFILRSGNIDNRKISGKADSLQEGSRIHRMIQKSMGPNYFPEVALSIRIPTSKYDIVIDGRADGIVFEAMSDISAVPLLGLKGGEMDNIPGLTITIDEIKSTYGDVNRMKKPVNVHLAQAKCYAYIYALQNELKIIRVRMTYVNVETEIRKYFHFDYSFEEISIWFEDLIEQYRKWADFEFEWKQKRQDSIKKLEFPFPYREGQKDLITYVYQTIYHRKKLFIEAPTGAGKTLATIFPSVKAMGENLIEKVFYLTAKTITRTVAEQALGILRKQDLNFKSMTLTAKDKICFQDEADCNPLACEYAKGHYDRINEALFDILTHVDNLSRDEILKYSIKYQVCPFEMSLDLAMFADMVICDYNYLFDPHAYLKRFFSEGSRCDYTFLIDEAHNLVDRGRSMYSAILMKEEFLKIKGIVKDFDDKIARACESCNKEMLSLKRESSDIRVLEEEEAAPLVRRILRLYSLIEYYMDEHEDSPINKELVMFYFELAHFLLIWENLDENYVIYTDFGEDNSFFIKLFNVNPAENLKKCMMRGRSSILFSATLLPIDYYKKLLGAQAGDFEVYAKSIFNPERRGLYIAGDVTSRYTRRNITEYTNIAAYIHRVVSNRNGHYMVFFPSFSFMKSVSDIYAEEYGDNNLLLQNQSMREADREEFLKAFEEDNEDTLIGMCVLGGIFSEGIDLKSNSLIGALIVGTGIPMVCNERQILKRYFDKDGVNGYDYAYKYPGMCKVLQAAGRVIRTTEDIGIVALLDERFMEPGYLRLFPREWANYEIVNMDSVNRRINRFWDEWL